MAVSTLTATNVATRSSLSLAVAAPPGGTSKYDWRRRNRKDTAVGNEALKLLLVQRQALLVVSCSDLDLRHLTINIAAAWMQFEPAHAPPSPVRQVLQVVLRCDRQVDRNRVLLAFVR